jgi:hypothetical protein
MSIADRVAALSPGRVGVAAVVAAIGGLVGLGVGIATGSIPLVVAAYAVIFGAGLLPAVADWCKATAAVEAVRRKNHEQVRIGSPQRCVETDTPSLTEARAIIKAYYAHLMNDHYSGSGRFQERVSAQDQPGHGRVH